MIDPQPGDVWFFSGRGWKSRLIAAITLHPAKMLAIVASFVVTFFLSHRPDCSLSAAFLVFVCFFASSHKFSHVGIIASDPHKIRNRLLMFESTTLNEVPCSLSGKVVRGVQAHVPWIRCEQYNGRILVASLKIPLMDDKAMALGDWLYAQVGQSYNYFGAALSGTRFLRHWWKPLHGKLHAFCSELVMLALKRVDIIGTNKRASRLNPRQLYDILWGSDKYVFRWEK